MPMRSGIRLASTVSEECLPLLYGMNQGADFLWSVTDWESSPLYYAQVGAEFIFASEIKALLAHRK